MWCRLNMVSSQCGFARPLIALVLLALAGCASHPDGVLKPVALSVPASDVVDMLVATTRAPVSGPAVDFTGERGDTMSLANISVSIPQDREFGQVQWPSAVPGDRPARLRHDEGGAACSQGCAALVQPGRRQVPSRLHLRPRLQHALRFRRLPLRADRPRHRCGRSAGALHLALARSLARLQLRPRERQFLAQRSCLCPGHRRRQPQCLGGHAPRPLHGLWIAMEALRQMALGAARNPAEDRQRHPRLARSRHRRFPPPARRKSAQGARDITVFTSAQDRALGVSSLIAGRVTRLGGIDLSSADYRRNSPTCRSLTFIDLSSLRSGDIVQPLHLRDQPRGRAPHRRPLDRGPAGHRFRLDFPARRTAQTIGYAAGTLVAAPFLILQGVQPP